MTSITCNTFSSHGTTCCNIRDFGTLHRDARHSNLTPFTGRGWWLKPTTGNDSLNSLLIFDITTTVWIRVRPMFSSGVG